MALKEIYHVTADSREVASGSTIKEGMIVTLNSSSQVIICDGATAYGIAGDTKNTTRSSMPGIDLGVPAGSQGWQNRVSDYYDETQASGKITVYVNGGVFATDQYTSNVGSAAVMTTLYGNNAGLLHTADTGTGAVAVVVAAAGAYPSGVPGVDLNGDIQLTSEEASNNYVTIKLLI